MKTKILMREFVTHDVIRVILEKPAGYKFVPGQALDISFSRGKLKGQKNAFTFAGLPEDLVLEFIVKIYKHNGFTQELASVPLGTELQIDEPFGTLMYKSPGVFIAGGAGITPFISILRDLKRKGKLGSNKLIFSNKTEKDIILEKELKNIFSKNPKNLIFTLTKQKLKDYEHGLVNSAFLKKHVKKFTNKRFYICGPPLMLFELRRDLKKLGASVDSIIFEK